MPLFNEHNVGFSQTFANLLLDTLPEDHGIVLLNTGVGGTVGALLFVFELYCYMFFSHRHYIESDSDGR